MPEFTLVNAMSAARRQVADDPLDQANRLEP